MNTFGQKIAMVLLLGLAVSVPSGAQKRNATYRNGELASVAAVTVAVDRFGITPTELTRPEGAFLLCVRNRRGDHNEHFSLTLDSAATATAAAAELYSLDTAAEKFHGAVLVDLQPGKYRLRLKNSPELSVAITIE